MKQKERDYERCHGFGSFFCFPVYFENVVLCYDTAITLINLCFFFLQCFFPHLCLCLSVKTGGMSFSLLLFNCICLAAYAAPASISSSCQQYFNAAHSAIPRQRCSSQFVVLGSLPALLPACMTLRQLGRYLGLGQG